MSQRREWPQVEMEGVSLHRPEGSLLEALLGLEKQKRIPQALLLQTPHTQAEAVEKARETKRQLRWE